MPNLETYRVGRWKGETHSREGKVFFFFFFWRKRKNNQPGMFWRRRKNNQPGIIR
jgi:hypothetical protein